MNKCRGILPISVMRRNNDSAMTLTELFQTLKHRHICKLSAHVRVMLELLTSSPSDTMIGTIWHISFKTGIFENVLSTAIRSFFVDFPLVPIMTIMFTHCTYPAITLGRYNSVTATRIMRALEDFPVTIDSSMLSVNKEHDED